LKQCGIDRLARSGNGGEPRDRLSAPGDIDGIARFDPVDQLTQMRLGIRQIDRFYATFLTM
jgi:hypothetical protein